MIGLVVEAFGWEVGPEAQRQSVDVVRGKIVEALNALSAVGAATLMAVLVSTVNTTKPELFLEVANTRRRAPRIPVQNFITH